MSGVSASQPVVQEPRPEAPRAVPARLANVLSQPRALTAALMLILLVGALFRFHGLNWDESRHLHPDERFLSSVTNDMKWPQDLSTYFDPVASTLSPYSLPNMGLFVYGTLPVYIVKWVSILLNDNNYDKITLVGRALSGAFDLAAILLLFLIARRLYGRSVALLAAALMALSVFNIQLSHFYAVDTYANLFIVATMFFVLRAADGGKWTDYALTGLMLGLGLASKISVLTLAAPILVGVGLDFRRQTQAGDVRSAVEHTAVRLLTVVGIAALTFRIAQPIAFAGPGFWNWSLNPRWLRDIVEQQKTVSGGSDQPWIQQWTDRSFLFPVYNIVVWGLGIPLGLASLAGLVLAGYELVRRRKMEHLLPLLYVTVTFIYHAATFVKFMRYFLPIYPFLGLFAAYFLVWLWQGAAARRASSADTMEGRRAKTGLLPAAGRVIFSASFAAAVALIVIGGTLLYAIAFSSIYSRTNTRVAASRWMYQNIAAGSTLANEHWDDWLPIGGVDGKTAYGTQGMFQAVTMANYEDDTPVKLDTLVQNLTNANYIILSSNRLYGSIPRLPIRYPMTSRYYQLLLSGKLGFDRVRLFTSYPQLLGLQIPDQVAEESFTVYDHPEVQIFQKSPAFNADLVKQELGQGVAWDEVIHLTPLQATKAPNGLRLSAGQQALYRQAAAASSAEVNANSRGSRLPLLAWFLALFVIGLLALPLTWTTFGRLVDRGYLFAKAIGLLLAAWGAWMLASLYIAPFTWWVVLLMLVLLGIGSAALVARNWPRMRRFLRTRWRLLLLEEALFWLFLLAMLYVRLHNPDLWHPATGGEKPMDVAYLNAIVRTPYFPSYDPWFTGGYINYYYFGFVLVAALIHLTGIVPEIAYNLAVPTFFALTAAGGFAVALNLAQSRAGAPLPNHRRRLSLGTATLMAGLCGAAFVAIIGNLAQVKLVWDGILSLSSLSASAGGTFFGTIAKFADGLNQWISGHRLPIHTDWWYWNATRVIPAGQGEAGPINEMPFFTYLFADLHAHAMALPYTLLALGLSLNVLLGTSRRTSANKRSWWNNTVEIATIALLALTTGALWPMNTWDFPTCTLLAGAALLFAKISARGRLDWRGAAEALLRLAIVVAGGWLLFLPFHANYASAYFGAEVWKGSGTPLWAYLLIHGFFLFVLASYMIGQVFSGTGHNAIVRSLRLNLRHWRHPARLHRLFNRLTNASPGYRLAVTLGQIALAVVIVAFVLDAPVGLAVGLGLLAGLLLWSKRADARRQFMLFIIGLGLMLTAVVELVVLKGDISRMNTVFKFYLQVWVMWAVVSAGVLPEIAARLGARRSGEAPGAVPAPQAAGTRHQRRTARQPLSAWARRWWWAFGLLLAACFLYPVTAAPVRMNDRFKNSVSVTLDGTTYMQTAVYMDDGRPVTLDWDLQAIDWLRQNVHGLPTILEANTPLYRWGSRVSIYTGFPTVIGWDWHQKQQRSVLPGQIVDRRLEDVRTIYNTTDPAAALRLLSQYNVNYVYVGPLEQLYYDPAGLAKFDQANPAWSLVYHNDQVKIFQVH